MRTLGRLAIPAVALLASCSLFVGLDGLSSGPAGACDGGACDTLGDGAVGESGSSSEGGATDAGTTYTYNDVADLENWEAFDMGSFVLDDAGDLPGLVGGTFDGRYVYFTPQRVGYTNGLSGLVLRYDTTKAFGDTGSWQSFDTSSLDPNATGFAGTGFDGKYVYFTPGYNSVAIRFDAAGDFASAGAWSHLDLATLPGAGSITGTAAFIAGKYVFFTPSLDYMVRYDTALAFDQANAWVGVNEVNVASAGTYNFGGCAFDGTHIFIFPRTGGPPAEALEYDTSQQIANAAAWSKFDMSQLDGGPFPAFEVGGVFDGRYVYATPDPSGAESVVARYDTSQPFESVQSWSQFDLTKNLSVSNDESTAGFDGRFLYVVPYDTGNLVRFDTKGTFSDVAAWTDFDMSSLPGQATSGFGGNTFDGSYIYFIPRGSSTAFRFHARTPAK